MEKETINRRLKEVKTVADFASLLDDIQHDEFEKCYYKITAKRLRYFSVSKKRYKSFKIKKKSGGVREINAPCRQLKTLLYLTNIVFKAVYTPSRAAMGFAENRSVVKNAEIHTGHNYVFNTDLKDFFPSIPQARVWKRLQLKPFFFTREVASVIAGMCCCRNAEGQFVLPQGAATSPLLTNAICDTLDRRLMGVAKRFGLHYSRYADDITFSSMHNVYQVGGDFRTELVRVITGQGFSINEKKTRLQRTGSRQEVTGLTVNEHTNVARKYCRDIRCILHHWEKDGYDKAYAYFYPKYKHDKGFIKRGEPIMENVVEGKLNYLRMVKGANDSVFKKLSARFNKLKSETYFGEKQKKTKEGWEYLFSFSVNEFEQRFNTSISLHVAGNNKLVGKCVIDEREVKLSISEQTQTFLCPTISDFAVDTTINSPTINNCFVTMCRAKRVNFWLLTKDQLGSQRIRIDIDMLLSVWEKEGLEAAAKQFNEITTSINPDKNLSNHQMGPQGNATSSNKENIIGPTGNHKVFTEEDLEKLDDAVLDDSKLIDFPDIDIDERDFPYDF